MKITLLYLPYTIDTTKDDMEYLSRTNLSLLPSQLKIAEQHMDKYLVYNNTTKIGMVVGYKIKSMWYAHRVLIYKKYRYCFKSVLHSVYEIVLSNGCNGIVLTPDEYTAKMYIKHNIAKEVTWE